MSNPVGQPVIPPQPNQLYYGVSALALFQTFTRETYLSALGIQAPAYDPTRVIPPRANRATLDCGFGVNPWWGAFSRATIGSGALSS